MIENKTRHIGFRASDSERVLIEMHAAALDMRISRYVMLCVLNDMAQRELPAKQEAARRNGAKNARKGGRKQ